MTARYTSKLVFESITTLTATQNPPADGTTNFVLLTNDGPQDFGPMSFTLVDGGMPGGSHGDRSHCRPTRTSACRRAPTAMTLAVRDQLPVGGHLREPRPARARDSAFLIFDVPGVVHAQAGFVGVGQPQP